MRTQRYAFILAFFGLAQFTAFVPGTFADPAPAIPWNLAAFEKTPATFPSPPEVPVNEELRSLCFEGPAYRGKPTHVFAYYGAPEGADAAHPVPAIVLVHGAGGTAFSDWVKLWNSRGYAAIAFDDDGNLPIGSFNQWTRNPDGGPRRTDIPGLGEPLTDQWMYHAVANSLLAHSLLRSFPEVDANRIGITGISWGGVVVSNVAGVDARLKFAVPVYGCGFLTQNVDDGSRFIAAKQSWAEVGEKVSEWSRLWDPSQFLPHARLPMLWVSGVNDFAFTPRARQLSYQAAPGPHFLSLRVVMKHGHGGPGESPEEIRAFADSIVKQTPPLARMTEQGHEGNRAWAEFAADVPLRSAELIFTRDTNRWQDRKWESQPGALTGKRVNATLPADATVYFFNVTDERGLVISSEHQTLR
ncbi:MAG: alpha/beta hydrolase family protein [Chthoniobacteraceae bacterium]